MRGETNTFLELDFETVNLPDWWDISSRLP
jgi:hypothetical protein